MSAAQDAPAIEQAPHLTADDRLCQDVLGVLLTMLRGHLTWERCLACGQLADSTQPCPTCASIRQRVAQRRRRTA